ncbi:TPA: hypothetical protein ACHIWN_000953 [Pseudomonas aeruginosa]
MQKIYNQDWNIQETKNYKLNIDISQKKKLTIECGSIHLQNNEVDMRKVSLQPRLTALSNDAYQMMMLPIPKI